MSRLLVLDCTVCAAWFLPDEASDDAQRILSDVLAHKSVMLVPSLWWFEIINVMKTAVRRKRIDEDAARRALFLLKEIPMETVQPDKQGQAGMLALTLETSLSAYDAAYLHLAHSSGAELFTADQDLLSMKTLYRLIKKPSEY